MENLKQSEYPTNIIDLVNKSVEFNMTINKMEKLNNELIDLIFEETVGNYMFSAKQLLHKFVELKLTTEQINKLPYSFNDKIIISLFDHLNLLQETNQRNVFFFNGKSITEVYFEDSITSIRTISLTKFNNNKSISFDLIFKSNRVRSKSVIKRNAYRFVISDINNEMNITDKNLINNLNITCSVRTIIDK